MVYPREPQFEARPYGRNYGVYDRWLGSWPVRRPELGDVAQNTTRDEAETDAIRCNTPLSTVDSTTC